MFVKNHHGAVNAALFYSFLVRAKSMVSTLLDWLTDVLQRIDEHPINKLHEVLPVEGYKFLNK